MRLFEIVQHHHYHHDEPPERVIGLLENILTRVDALYAQGVHIMSKESDLKDDLDAIQTGVASVLASQTAQAATIADLKAQLAAGTPVSQEQLDALDTEAKAIVASLTPLAPPAA